MGTACECGGKATVVDTVTQGENTYRRRRCSLCKSFIYTVSTETRLVSAPYGLFSKHPAGVSHRKKVTPTTYVLTSSP